MIKINKDDIYTATEVVRNFSSILDKVQKKQKIIIHRNSKLEAIILNLDEYSKLCNALEVLENYYDKKRG